MTSKNAPLSEAQAKARAAFLNRELTHLHYEPYVKRSGGYGLRFCRASDPLRQWVVAA